MRGLGGQGSLPGVCKDLEGEFGQAKNQWFRGAE